MITIQVFRVVGPASKRSKFECTRDGGALLGGGILRQAVQAARREVEEVFGGGDTKRKVSITFPQEHRIDLLVTSEGQDGQHLTPLPPRFLQPLTRKQIAQFWELYSEQ